MPQPEAFQNVDYSWDDAYAGTLEPLARLVYRSNILGDDLRITNSGGGITSSKIAEIDPLTGESVAVLWTTESDADLRTTTPENFAALYLDKFMELQGFYDAAIDTGVRMPFEDTMVAMYRHCAFNLNTRDAPVDTALHAFVPHTHVDHTHPSACLAIAACADQEKITREVYGDRVGWIPWSRPGFELGLSLMRECVAHPEYEGVLLGQHGLINWADGDRECYELTLDLIEEASRYIAGRDRGEQSFGGRKHFPLDEGERRAVLMEVMPWLRGQIGGKRGKVIATKQTDEAMQQFVNSRDAARLAGMGVSCPDYFLRTKVKPLYVDWNPQGETVEELKRRLEAGLEQYRADYTTYYETCKHLDSPPMRDPNPTVILVPGVGMIAFGPNKSESRMTAEFFVSSVRAMRGAEAVSSYTTLPEQEAFDIEYRAAEDARHRRRKASGEFEGSVALVIGAGHELGKAVAHRMARGGAHVVCADNDKEAANATSAELTGTYGFGTGRAGTGHSNCGPAVGAQVDITDRSSVETIVEDAVMAYGGIDSVIITTGLFVPTDEFGRIEDEDWALTFDVNITGQYIVADEVSRVWRAQGTPGSLVLTTSASAIAARRGNVAYDVSKSAANHLVRELAVELAPLVRVNGLAPSTVVKGSLLFDRERVITLLSQYELEFSESENTEILRNRLARFYADRTLTREPVTNADQAEAACLLTGAKLGCTTGQILAVDGGFREAFLR